MACCHLDRASLRRASAAQSLLRRRGAGPRSAVASRAMYASPARGHRVAMSGRSPRAGAGTPANPRFAIPEWMRSRTRPGCSPGRWPLGRRGPALRQSQEREQRLIMLNHLFQRGRTVVVEVGGRLANAEERRHVEAAEFADISGDQPPTRVRRGDYRLVLAVGQRHDIVLGRKMCRGKVVEETRGPGGLHEDVDERLCARQRPSLGDR